MKHLICAISHLFDKKKGIQGFIQVFRFYIICRSTNPLIPRLVSKLLIMQTLQNCLPKLSSTLSQEILPILQIKIMRIKIQGISSNTHSCSHCSNRKSNDHSRSTTYGSNSTTDNNCLYRKRRKSNCKLKSCLIFLVFRPYLIDLGNQFRLIHRLKVSPHIQSKKRHINHHSSFQTFCPLC